MKGWTVKKNILSSQIGLEVGGCLCLIPLLLPHLCLGPTALSLAPASSRQVSIAQTKAQLRMRLQRPTMTDKDPAVEGYPVVLSW